MMTYKEYKALKITHMERWLNIKVWIISLLRHLKIIKNVWYKSEIKRAKLEAIRTAHFFKACQQWQDKHREDNDDEL